MSRDLNIVRFIGLLSLVSIAANSVAADPKHPTSNTGFAATEAAGMRDMIVTCREGVELDTVLRECGTSATHKWKHALNGFAGKMNASTIQRLRRDHRVLAVEEDGPVVLCEQTNSAGLLRMAITNFPLARIGSGQRINVDVAVLDTGVQTNHPDLNVYRTTNFVESGLNGNDWNGHGTRMAGILGALDNDFGVVGVAPGVRIWNVQVLGRIRSTQTTVVNGLNYVAQHANEISVVNCSLVSTGNVALAAWRTSINSLLAKGTVVIAGAGNDGRDIVGLDGVFGYNGSADGFLLCDDVFPAAMPQVMAVSGVDPVTDQIWSNSNFSGVARTNSGLPNNITNYVFSPGGAIDVTAPAVGIVSTSTNSGYAVGTGTSAATAHVSGLVALYIAANGRATNAEGVYRIRQAIVDHGLAQSQWNTTNTLDPDGNPEPLAFPSENWIPVPRIAGANMTTNGFELSIPAVPGYDYAVEYKDSLSLSNQWTLFSKVRSSTGSVTTVTATDPSTSASRFYRLNRQPAP